MRLLCIFCLVVAGGAGQSLAEEEQEVFSGPQVGEALEAFTVRGAYELAGKDVDFVKDAAGKPLVLIFVHELNRPTVGITRILASYLLTRHKDGLESGVVWLAESVDEGERTLKRIRHAMTDNAPTGISVDGIEGPGAYGLNRNVQITVLVAKEDKITANFALVQPSVQADLPKILQAVVDVVGGEVPKLDDLPAMREMQRDRMRNSKQKETPGDKSNAEAAERLRPLLRKLIRKGANAEEIEAAAEAVEKFVAEDEAAKKELHRIATTIVDSGKLENYGEAAAQDVLRRWAEEAKEKEEAKETGDGENKPQDDKPSDSPAKPKSDA